MLFGYAGFLYEAIRAHVMERPRAHAAAGLVILALVLGALFAPPFGFPTGGSVELRSDETFRQAANELAAARVVWSAHLLLALARLSGADTAVQAGRYAFPAPEGAAIVLYRLANGATETPAKRVTFPEGSTAREMSEALAAAIPGFDAATFLALAKPDEGFLFPDTYDFPEDATPQEAIARMRERFDEVWAEAEQAAADAPKGTLVRSADSQLRVVTMASLLEKETKADEDRRIVSGILWHRIDIGMALQVDAVFGYIKGIDTYHPTAADLEIKSPYNTYLNRDLPPGPIGNPGKDALLAALMPEPSSYLYYLTDESGALHYAATFDEHKANKAKYLK